MPDASTSAAGVSLGLAFGIAVVVGVFVFQIVLWVFIGRVIQKKIAERRAALGQRLAQLAATGEATVLPATGCFLRVGYVTRSNVHLALTTGRLVWNFGKPGEVPLGEVRHVTVASNYSGSYRAGIRWLIVQTATGELGFGLREGEHAQWESELTRRLGRA